MALADVLGIASAVTLAAVGIALLVARPRRADAKVFAFFLLVWSLDITVANLDSFWVGRGRFDLANLMLRATLALTILETLLLVQFAVLFAARRGAVRRAWPLLVLGWVVVVGGWLALRPGDFADDLGFTSAAALGVILPNFVAFFITISVLLDRWRKPRGTYEADEANVVLPAFLIYAAYLTGFTLTDFTFTLAEEIDFTGPVVAYTFLGLFAACALMLAVIAVLVVRADRDSRAPLWAIMVPFAVGVITELPDVLGGGAIDLVGLARIATAVLIAYGLARYEFFGIDLRLKTSVRRGTIAAAFLLVFFITSELVEALVSNTAGTIAGFATAAALAIAFRPLERASDQLSLQIFPSVEDTPEYRANRSVQIYEAALEVAWRDGVITDAEQAALAQLRESLAIGETDAMRIEERIAGSHRGARR